MSSTNTTLKLSHGHSNGPTEVCYDNEGARFVSCGSDGKVRIWKDVEDDNAKTIKVGDHVSSIAVCNETLYVASNTNSIEKYTFPKCELDGLLARFTGSVTNINVSESKTFICAGSSDFDIKTINLKTGKQDCFLGHQAPVLSVAVDPLDEYLASCSCDGNLKIWNLKSNKCEKTIPVIPSSNDVGNSKSLGKISWRPTTGEDIAVPCKDGVKIFARITWAEDQHFTTDVTTSLFQCCSFSLCGRFLAASTKDGWIVVWDVETTTCVRKSQHPLKTCICSVEWNPKQNNSLVFSDTRGQVGVLNDVVASEPASDVPTRGEIDALFDDDDNDDLMMADDPSEDKKPPPNIEGLFDECAEDNDDIADLPAIPSTLEVLASKDVDQDLAEAPLLRPSKIIDEDSNSYPPPVAGENLNQGHSSMSIMQPPFQSGSTPSYLSNRFMVWNQIGFVRCYNDSDDHAIDVEFHNQGIHHPIHFTNHDLFTMADMSYKAVVFASNEIEDKPSKLKCLHYTSWDSNREWSIDMNEGEDIQAITIGECWIAACTNDYQVRIFSIGGVQRQIFSISGPVVCMAGHTDQLIIAYHITQGFSMNQCLGFMLLELGVGSGCKPRNVVPGRPLPISKTSTLTWLGFTAEGTPASCDSKGVLRLMNRSFCEAWTTAAEMEKMTKSRHDHYWIVGLMENPQQIRCILCKGTTYPPTLPRPVLSVQEYKLPLCEINTDKSKFEEQYWKTKLFSTCNDYLKSRGYETDNNFTLESQQKTRQVLMQLFALLCKSDQDFQAHEVCSMMATSDSINLAIKYASRIKKTSLAQRLIEVVQQKAQEEVERSQKQLREEESEEEEEEDYKAEIQSGYSNSPTSWQKGGQSKVTPSPLSTQSSSVSSVNIEQNERVNPFKKSSAKLNSKPEVDEVEGESVLDGIKLNLKKQKRSTMSLSSSLRKGKESAKKEKHQSKLNLTSTPKGKRPQSATTYKLTEQKNSSERKMSGVQLYIEENISSFQTENPDDSMSDIRKKAMQAFRALTQEDKENWNKMAKSSNNIREKRKLDDDDDNNSPAIRQKLDSFKNENNQNDVKSKLQKFAAI